MQALLEALGHPERAYAAVHVAGTNGKGSVCALVESVLRAAGLRTGLFTSPHLLRFNERLRVQGRCVADSALAELFSRLEEAEQTLLPERLPRPATYFECSAAMAFEHFRRRRVQLAVVETGMGGRWDATNVLQAPVAVITSIALDHQQTLGRTLAKIAAEKAGILKGGGYVVCGRLPPTARDVVVAAARDRKVTLIDAGEVAVRRIASDWSGQVLQVSTPARDLGRLKIPLLGKHQIDNVALSVAALEALEGVLGVEWPMEAWQEGMGRVVWPARMQVMQADPPVLVDGAHNCAGLQALGHSLRDLAPARPVGLVFGCMADKDVAGMLRTAACFASRAWLSPPRAERALEGEGLLKAAEAVGWTSKITPMNSALEQAIAWARARNGVVCVAGSLYLAREVYACYGHEPFYRDAEQEEV